MSYKIQIYAVGLLGCFLAGCGEKSTSSQEQGSTPLVLAMETAYSPPSGKPILAPEGVVFLKEPVSFQHATGVQGILQGTAVNVVEEKGDGSLLVEHKERKFSVKPHQVTNDMGEAEWLFQLEQAKQRQLAKAQLDQRSIQLSHEQQRQAVFARALNEAAAKKSSAALPTSPAGTAPGAKFDTRLNRSAYNPSRRSPIHIGHEVDGRRFWVDGGGTKHYIYDAQPHTFEPKAQSSPTGARAYEEEDVPEAKLPEVLQRLLRGELD